MVARKKIVYVAEPPEGLFYIPRFLSEERQREIVSAVSKLSFAPYDHHGYKANREVVYFGTESYSDLPGVQIESVFPDWLNDLRTELTDLIGLEQEELAMALVARYDTGAGIGWHRDRPQFGPSVIGVSLAADAEMRFRRFVGAVEEMYKINLGIGSAYIIGGAARSSWQHGMKPVETLRYSITFRTISDKKRDANDHRHAPHVISRRLNERQVQYNPAARKEEPVQLNLTFGKPV